MARRAARSCDGVKDQNTKPTNPSKIIINLGRNGTKNGIGQKESLPSRLLCVFYLSYNSLSAPMVRSKSDELYPAHKKVYSAAIKAKWKEIQEMTSNVVKRGDCILATNPRRKDGMVRFEYRGDDAPRLGLDITRALAMRWYCKKNPKVTSLGHLKKITLCGNFNCCSKLHLCLTTEAEIKEREECFHACL